MAPNGSSRGGPQKNQLADSDGKVRPFQCDECGKRFTARGSLKSHRSVHTGEKPYKCEDCGQRFTQVGQMRLHARLHTGEKPHKCQECGKTYAQKSALTTHSHTHAEEKPFACEVCGRPFKQKQALTSHILTHSNTRPYKCDECDKCYTAPSDLARHKKTQHIELIGKHECEVCGARFHRSCAKRDHMYVHTGERPLKYTCKNCDACFIFYSGLLRHQIKVHGNHYPYKCEECGKQFKYNVEKNTHMLIHTGELPFKCGECGEKFRRSSHLRCHQLKHTGKYPFVCKEPECTFRCASKSTFVVHMRKHAGVRPFACDECQKCFRSEGQLKHHTALHNDSSYSCPECKTRFIYESQLNEHLLLHTGERPHKCNECGNSYRTRAELSHHSFDHSGYHPHPCSLCTKKFVHESQLIAHCRTHTGERPYQCNECKKNFTIRGRLTRHKLLHKRDCPKCEICNERFATLERLESHITFHLAKSLISCTGMPPFKCELCSKTLPNKSDLWFHHQWKHSAEKPNQCTECGKSFLTHSDLKSHQIAARQHPCTGQGKLRQMRRICEQAVNVGNSARLSTQYIAAMSRPAAECVDSFSATNDPSAAMNNVVNAERGISQCSSAALQVLDFEEPYEEIVEPSQETNNSANIADVTVQCTNSLPLPSNFEYSRWLKMLNDLHEETDHLGNNAQHGSDGIVLEHFVPFTMVDYHVQETDHDHVINTTHVASYI